MCLSHKTTGLRFTYKTLKLDTESHTENRYFFDVASVGNTIKQELLYHNTK